MAKYSFQLKNFVSTETYKNEDVHPSVVSSSPSYVHATRLSSIATVAWTTSESFHVIIIDVAREKQCKGYNILPLDNNGASHAIMELPQIKAAISALRKIDGLTWPPAFEPKTDDLDLFDWLGAMFGFQRDSVRNQREHLIMLLANVQMRLDLEPKSMDKLNDSSIDAVMNKLFQNYETWCKFLGHSSRLPDSPQAVQHEKILYIGLYLLIWGEAANLRFMPECLCCIFHNMAQELFSFLAGEVRIATGENIKPSGEDQSFLCKVIAPLYRVIEKEAQKGKDGKAPHSDWCNYDDLNEYFWSPDCLSLGWPMRIGGFFCEPMRENGKGTKVSQATFDNVRKSNFVETRTFWHIFHSFSRLWSFYLLAFQVLVIVAWIETPTLPYFWRNVLYPVSSVFITASLLGLLQSILDVVINSPFQRNWLFTDVLRSVLKIIVSLTWAAALPHFYVRSFNVAAHQARDFAAQYIMTAALYTVPNLLAAALCFIPMLREYLETSNWPFIRLLLWWSQPRSYVGRVMPESLMSFIKYGLFWVLVLAAKFAFSFKFMIRPLVMSTKYIMASNKVRYQRPEFSSRAQSNFGVLATLWAPVVLVFFLDTQIWYTIFASVFSDIIGNFLRLEKVKNIKTLRKKFQRLPGAFVDRLMAKSPSPEKDSSSSIHLIKASKGKITEAAGFSFLWNEIIGSYREEDILNDREKDLLLVPYSSGICLDIIQWPLFFLAGKIQRALDMAVKCGPRDRDLWKQISSDEFMKCAVIECYSSFKQVLKTLVADKPDERLISSIFEEVKTCISMNTGNFKMSVLPTLYQKIVALVEYLGNGNACKLDTVVLLLQDVLEVVTRDMMVNEIRGLSELGSSGEDRNQPFASIVLPEATPQWKAQIKRLYLLLTVKKTALTNLETEKRISFFANSLFMDMPCAPTVSKMLSFSVLTPYYNEETIYSSYDIDMKNEDGISILYYLQKIFPDEWNNFMERINCKKETDVWRNEEKVVLLRHWVSLRGQTLCRTVRGMMYYGRALRLQAFLEMANEQEIQGGYAAVMDQIEDVGSQGSLYARIAALADLKFTYVITCQNYGCQKRSGDRRAMDILKLLINNPSLRVAYVDEVEEGEGTGKGQKSYYSVLIKASGNLEQEIYRVKLPGTPKVGEGKPENQNHAIIFTRGEALQAIDMNQDNYLEEALKMRNLLQEFNEDHGVRPPTILGVREHVFTGSFSSLAWFMANQETSFFTAQQRVFAKLLKVRFHYGHPDVFDRLFHITSGGISKASRCINLSEDIFAGFNSVLRRGNVTHHEYIQVGKGRDIGLNQISTFEAKIACGNGEQTLSRDLHRLGNHYDFVRMLSCYYTTIGYFISSMMAVLTSYAFLYGRLYLSLGGLDQSIGTLAKLMGETALYTAMTTVSFFQIGVLMALPTIKMIAQLQGYKAALKQLPLPAIYSTFCLGMKVHYYGRTILHGGAKYRATGRGFAMHHENFSENYRKYSRSHFTKGLELVMLLTIYHLYGSVSPAYVVAPLWFLVVSWLFAPFVFNPSGFEWQKIVDDWYDWMKWINSHGGSGVPPTESWESWWEEEQQHLVHTGVLGRFWEIVLSLRFFLIQYWLVYRYHLKVADGDIRRMVYTMSWLVIVIVAVIVKIESVAIRKLNPKLNLGYRPLKALLFVGSAVTLSLVFLFLNLKLGDVFICLLAFVPAGWGLLTIALALKPLMKDLNLWSSIKALARVYEHMMGIIVFTPVALLAWFPFVSEFHSSILFNKDFSHGLHSNRRLAAAKKS